MKRLDEQEALAFDSEFCCAVLGHIDRGFVLVDLGRDSLNVDELLQAHKGFHYAGILGYRRGECVARCEPDADSISICAVAATEFAQRVAQRRVGDRIELKPKDDSATWLETLYRLRDPRHN
jgi:hypothetical protein